MLFILVIAGLLLIVAGVGKNVLSLNFKRDVTSLFSHSENISNFTFTYKQLEGLPEPVQRYFKYALDEGQPYISFVRLKHDGTFRTGPQKDWINIRGEEYFTIERPGFIWKGITSMFTATDKYIYNQGELNVFLFGLIRIAGGRGVKYDQGELLRWLGESVWFPTNLLPGQNVKWRPIDNETARVDFYHQNLWYGYQVRFNEIGEIIELQTERYMGHGNLETWIGKVSEYKKIEGVRIPTAIEAIYRLKEGDHCYAKFYIRSIDYDIPELFK